MLTLRSRGGLVDAAQASELEEKVVLRAGDPERHWRLPWACWRLRVSPLDVCLGGAAVRLIGVVGLV